MNITNYQAINDTDANDLRTM